MSNVTPLHDYLGPLKDAADLIEKHGPHRIVVILDGGDADSVLSAGFDDDMEVMALLEKWRTEYLIDEILDRIE